MTIPTLAQVLFILAMEFGLLFWCFWDIDAPAQKGLRRWAAPMLLLPVLGVYFPAVMGISQGVFRSTALEMALRYLLRLVPVFLYLLAAKEIRVKRAFYFAALYTIQYHTYRMVMGRSCFEPVLRDLLSGLSPFWAQFLEFAVDFLVAWLLTFAVKQMVFRKPTRGNLTLRVVFVSTALVICIVLRTALATLMGRFTDSVTLAFLLSLVPLLLLAAILLQERDISVRAELEEERTQKLMDHYRLKAIERRQERDEDLRTLGHDYKNHLLALRGLSREGDPADVEQYINDVLDTYDLDQASVDTGSTLINGLIGVKLEEARSKGIRTSVVMDARKLAFVSDADLCTVLGNALDNALEACEKVKDPDRRFLDIRGGNIANQQFIAVTNSCGDVPEFQNGLPVSTKEDRDAHGLGLRNLKKTVEKYGGSLSFEVEPDRFTLTVLFPEK